MHWRYRHITAITVLVCCIVMACSAAAMQSTEQSLGDSMTRGSRFTETITGNPNTTYYIWLTGTSTMSGENYDQPPIISDTADVVKDPEGGPYLIGSYRYNNGGGSTIRDDVAPSTPNMSNTNYYAQVTTDERGQAIVEFRTSAYTAVRSYSIKVENPNAPESENFGVGQTVYRRTARPMINTPAATAIPTYMTAVTTPTTVPVTTETAPVTVLLTISPQSQPTKKSPLPGEGIVIAAAAGTCLAVLMRRKPL